MFAYLQIHRKRLNKGCGRGQSADKEIIGLLKTQMRLIEIHKCDFPSKSEWSNRRPIGTFHFHERFHVLFCDLTSDANVFLKTNMDTSPK